MCFIYVRRRAFYTRRQNDATRALWCVWRDMSEWGFCVNRQRANGLRGDGESRECGGVEEVNGVSACLCAVERVEPNIWGREWLCVCVCYLCVVLCVKKTFSRATDGYEECVFVSCEQNFFYVYANNPGTRSHAIGVLHLPRKTHTQHLDVVREYK